MIDLEKIKPLIIEKLKPLNPKKIIIFGSYAYGNPTEDSDLDICVVEKDYKNKYGSVYKDINEKGIILWNS